MLIEFSAKTDHTGSLSWYNPKLNLDRRFSYKVGLRHLNFQLLDQSQNINRNHLFCLTSNLVDLSSRNPSQSLCIFDYDGEYPNHSIIPSIIAYHPVQLYELENVSFAIRHYFEEREVDLYQIFVHLEILRLDSYGRLQ